jgi:hypothetical protein
MSKRVIGDRQVPRFVIERDLTAAVLVQEGATADSESSCGAIAQNRAWNCSAENIRHSGA